MNDGNPAKIVDYKLIKNRENVGSWLTIIDFKSCLVMFENSNISKEETQTKQKIKVYSCYAA